MARSVGSLWPSELAKVPECGLSREHGLTRGDLRHGRRRFGLWGQAAVNPGCGRPPPTLLVREPRATTN